MLSDCELKRILDAAPFSTDVSNLLKSALKNLRRCPFCSELFARSSDLTTHLVTEHQCSLTSSGSKEITDHCVEEQDRLIFICPHCHFAVGVESHKYGPPGPTSTIKGHVQECPWNLSGRTGPARIEYRESHDRELINTYLRNSAVIELFPCPKCAQYFGGAHALARHLALDHSAASLENLNEEQLLAIRLAAHNLLDTRAAASNTIRIAVPQPTSLEIPPQPTNINVQSERTSVEAPLKPTSIKVLPKPTSIKGPPKPTSAEVPPQPPSIKVQPEPISVEAPPQPTSIKIPPKPTGTEFQPKATSVEVSPQPPSIKIQPEPTSIEAPRQPPVIKCPPTPTNVEAPLQPNSIKILPKPTNTEVQSKPTSFEAPPQLPSIKVEPKAGELIGEVFSHTVVQLEIDSGNVNLPPRLSACLQPASHLTVQFFGGEDATVLSFDSSIGRLTGLRGWLRKSNIEPGDQINFRLLAVTPPTVRLWTEWNKNLNYVFRCPAEDFEWEQIPIRDCLIKVFARHQGPMHYRVLYSRISKHRDLAIGSVIATLSKHQGVLFEHVGRGIWSRSNENSKAGDFTTSDSKSSRENSAPSDAINETIWRIVAEIEQRDFVYRLLERLHESLSFGQICQWLAREFHIDWHKLRDTGFINLDDPRLMRIDDGQFALRKWIENPVVTPAPASTGNKVVRPAGPDVNTTNSAPASRITPSVRRGLISRMKRTVRTLFESFIRWVLRRSHG